MCHHKDLGDKTPKEVFTSVKEEVSNFCIFGCPIYIHIPFEKRTKLEPSSKKGLFIGYSETSKAYKIYIPRERKTIVSMDVKFEEDFASRKPHDHILVTKDEEQESPKVELESPVNFSLGQQPSSVEEEAPTTFKCRRGGAISYQFS